MRNNFFVENKAQFLFIVLGSLEKINSISGNSRSFYVSIQVICL